MIDFRVSPRRSGKTTEILNRFLRTGGTITGPYSYYRTKYRNLIPENAYIKINSRLIELVFTSVEYLYFDDFFNQDKITLEDIINMDIVKPELNIIIRGSYTNHKIKSLDYFKQYLIDKYPEMMI